MLPIESLRTRILLMLQKQQSNNKKCALSHLQRYPVNVSWHRNIFCFNISYILSFPLSVIFLQAYTLYWNFAVYIYPSVNLSFKTRKTALQVSGAKPCNRNKNAHGIWSDAKPQSLWHSVSACVSVCHLHIVLWPSGPESFGWKKPSW